MESDMIHEQLYSLEKHDMSCRKLNFAMFSLLVNFWDKSREMEGNMGLRVNIWRTYVKIPHTGDTNSLDQCG